MLCVRVKYKTEKSQQDHIVSHKLFVITTPRHTQNSENPKDTDTVASPSKRSKKPNKKITRKSNGKKAFPTQYFSIQIFFCRPRRRWQRCRGGGGVWGERKKQRKTDNTHTHTCGSIGEDEMVVVWWFGGGGDDDVCCLIHKVRERDSQRVRKAYCALYNNAVLREWERTHTDRQTHTPLCLFITSFEKQKKITVKKRDTLNTKRESKGAHINSEINKLSSSAITTTTTKTIGKLLVKKKNEPTTKLVNENETEDKNWRAPIFKKKRILLLPTSILGTKSAMLCAHATHIHTLHIPSSANRDKHTDRQTIHAGFSTLKVSAIWFGGKFI